MTSDIANEVKRDEEAVSVDTQTVISACGCDTDHNGGEYISVIYGNKKIYFCEASCKQEFLTDPKTFLASDHFTLEFELLEDS